MYMSREVCHQSRPGGSRSAHDGCDDKGRSWGKVLGLEPWRMLLDQEEGPGLIRMAVMTREGVKGADSGF